MVGQQGGHFLLVMLPNGVGLFPGFQGGGKQGADKREVAMEDLGRQIETPGDALGAVDQQMVKL